MTERPLTVECSPANRVLTVHGCVDAEATGAFAEALESATHGYTHDLVLDLSDVDFFPALAIGVLVGTMRAGAATVTVVARPGCAARRTLELCGLSCGLPA